MENWLDRTEKIFGKNSIEKLASSHVAVFGLGGVGGHAAEALARSGVGALTLVDGDTVSITNINRQLVATTANVGMPKATEFEKRIALINPDCRIFAVVKFFSSENAGEFDFKSFDYIVDAVDDVKAKTALAAAAKLYGIRIISSMGTANKLCPNRFEVSDIYKTSVDPLAKVMRKELKTAGIESLKVVYSREDPVKTPVPGQLGSNAFVPASAGLLIASEVVKELTDMA